MVKVWWIQFGYVVFATGFNVWKSGCLSVYASMAIIVSTQASG
jgi:hypothetical protein